MSSISHNDKHRKNRLKDMVVVQWNCFKLTKSRIVELRLFLEEFKPDIMSIQEVKMNEEEANLSLRFESYSAFYKARRKGPTFGGGVAILVREGLSCSRIPEMSAELDCIGVRIETAELNFNIFSLYSPANTLKLDTVQKFCELGPELLILGDLNAKTFSVGCKSYDNNGRVLDEILSETSLAVLNDNSPTYFGRNDEYEEILDLIICSGLLVNKAAFFQVLSNHMMGSDHASVLCSLKFEKSYYREEGESETRFNFRRANWGRFKKIMEESIENSLGIDESEDIHFLNEFLSGVILDAADAT